MSNTGRPEYTDTQYHAWFDDLAPFFKLGETLSAAIDDARLRQHRSTLYEKVKLNDWFSDEMRRLQAIPGILANNILVRRVMLVDEKIRRGLKVDAEEMRDVRFVAEKHRSSQPYFVTRHEVANKSLDEIDRVLETLESGDHVVRYRGLSEDAKAMLRAMVGSQRQSTS